MAASHLLFAFFFGVYRARVFRRILGRAEITQLIAGRRYGRSQLDAC